MKRTRAIVKVLFLLSAFQVGTVLAQTPSLTQKRPKQFVPPPAYLLKKPDFRQAHWGMSKDEVKQSETVELRTADRSETTLETLVGTGSVAGMPCIIFYEFAEDQLVSASYVIAGKTAAGLKRHTSDNSYLEDYETLKGILREKYGTPLNDETTWRNPLYRDSPARYGLAVSLGHLQESVAWLTPTTRLGAVISGDNYDIGIVVLYQSLGLSDLAEKARKAKVASQF